MTEPTAAPAARRPTPDMLVDVDRLIGAYYDEHPDPSNPAQAVSFGTSGHRGTSLTGTFTESHILAISEAIARYRKAQGYDGPLFLGRDTHALSHPAFRTAVEVLVAHGVEVAVDAEDGFTPTPAVSHAILTHNARGGARADGVVITPSHNPPEDGGFKYNPPHGGPADTDVTRQIQDAANALLRDGLNGAQRVPFDEAIERARRHDYRSAYVSDLSAVVDVDEIAGSGIRLGVDPLGGASVAYWEAIADRHRIDLEVVNDRVDPTFSFMPLDHDGKIRMDCSSPDAMANLIAIKDRFDVAFANDPDADRHGIVTHAGLLNPNQYLAAAISYLLGGVRLDWPDGAGVGKTMVSSSIIDRVVAGLGRRLEEVPVGFKWFVGGLIDGTLAFGGEESAGASFLRRNGHAWSTDKDGLIMCLLAAEMTARTGKDPTRLYADLTERYGAPVYRRIDAPATAEQKRVLGSLSPESLTATELAGEPITQVLTAAPSGAPLGGVKAVTESGWFAARPSGTEDVYKLYAESFKGPEHLERILDEAQAVVDAALGG
ncbi:MAG TPA: phosphoglucomutase (alpha-D-glucose-1,6-bisphosphate-dependent) [Solirubrobacteraceae bacterium]|nr:phosphoglucomutase (alpha-D-glucose-1,6-bisphosphate-dependent) [Solirubrobacteraceae bacterium]